MKEVHFRPLSEHERLQHLGSSYQCRRGAEQVSAVARPHSMQCLTGCNNKLLSQLPRCHRQSLSTLKPCRQQLHGSRYRVCQVPKGLLDNLFGNRASSELHPDGPVFAPIDTESDGGLGGTSEGLFGPLVHSDFHIKLTFRPAESIFN